MQNHHHHQKNQNHQGGVTALEQNTYWIDLNDER
jgi:hypothetical protein